MNASILAVMAIMFYLLDEFLHVGDVICHLWVPSQANLSQRHLFLGR